MGRGQRLRPRVPSSTSRCGGPQVGDDGLGRSKRGRVDRGAALRDRHHPSGPDPSAPPAAAPLPVRGRGSRCARRRRRGPPWPTTASPSRSRRGRGARRPAPRGWRAQSSPVAVEHGLGVIPSVDHPLGQVEVDLRPHHRRCRQPLHDALLANRLRPARRPRRRGRSSPAVGRHRERGAHICLSAARCRPLSAPPRHVE